MAISLQFVPEARPSGKIVLELSQKSIALREGIVNATTGCLDVHYRVNPRSRQRYSRNEVSFTSKSRTEMFSFRAIRKLEYFFSGGQEGTQALSGHILFSSSPRTCTAGQLSPMSFSATSSSPSFPPRDAGCVIFFYYPFTSDRPLSFASVILNGASICNGYCHITNQLYSHICAFLLKWANLGPTPTAERIMAGPTMSLRCTRTNECRSPARRQCRPWR
jgi:hypothetical protein